MKGLFARFRQIFRSDIRLRQLSLLLVSFCIYFFYFQYEILHLNSILSSITGDSIKNYFTFVYHVKNDTSFLHFSGQNHPYGEHVVYTDCQPLLTFVLRLLPFTHNYLIGILHGLLLLSYIITPLILYRIFMLRNLPAIPAFFCSLASALLSPLFIKLFWGHYALMYNCLIPLEILLVLRLLQSPRWRMMSWLFLYNTLLFFIHPYTGMSACLFALAALFFASIQKKKSWLRTNLFGIITGILPILIFRVFLLLTDDTTGRNPEPPNQMSLFSGIGCLLVPTFGPLGSFLSGLFHTGPANYEGLCYIGAFLIFFCPVVLLVYLFIIRKQSWQSDGATMLFASLVLLVISFGYLNKLLLVLDLPVQDLKHFRALGRLAIYFYFILPVSLFPMASKALEHFKLQHSSRWLVTFSLLFFVFNLFESHYLLTYDRQAFWKFRNFFNPKLLNAEEKKVLALIDSVKPQAIITLPIFMHGSDVIDRDNTNNSMIPSALYSFHSGLPIIGSDLDRTSVPHTAAILNLLNSTKRDKPAAMLLTGQPLLVLKTSNPLMPDEKRLASRTTYFQRNDTLSIGFVGKEDLIRNVNGNVTYFTYDRSHIKENFIFIPFEQRKPFIQSRFEDYEKVHEFQPGQLKPGKYIVSFHYHYTALSFDAFACNMIVTKSDGKKYDWFLNVGVSKASGMYDGFAVFEHEFPVEEGLKYEFLMKGIVPGNYHIRNFMVRREDALWVSVTGRDSTFNNFPR